MLLNLSQILGDAYTNIKNNVNQITSLYEIIGKLLDLSIENKAHWQRKKTLCSSLYALLYIVNTLILNMTFIKKGIVSSFINIEKQKTAIIHLLKHIEDTDKMLDTQLSSVLNIEKQESAVKSKPLQEEYNEQFLAVLNQSGSVEERLGVLESTMSSVITSISKVITEKSKNAGIELQLTRPRDKKSELNSQVLAISELLDAIQQNDRKISGRKYVLDLIGDHKTVYAWLLADMSADEHRSWHDKIEQLEKPDIKQKVLYVMSWANSLTTIVYRSAAPQAFQNVASFRTLTLDSQCKAELQCLANSCRDRLTNELSKVDASMQALNNQFSYKDSQDNPRLANETITNLNLLISANEEAKQAVLSYRSLFSSIKKNATILEKLKQNDSTLDQFIQTHDGFLVWISNIFANLSVIFKSETATMIDESRALRGRIAGDKQCYTQIIAQNMGLIDNNLSITQEIKDKLKEQFKSVVNERSQPVQVLEPSLQNVRNLIQERKRIYTQSTPHVTQEDDIPLLRCI